MNHQKINKTAISSNSFVSVPDAFDGASEVMKYALKMETSNFFSDNEILGEQFFTSDRLLIDFGTANFSDTDLKKVKRDCELIIQIIENYPNEVKSILEALNPQNPAENAAKTFNVAQKIGFTELDFASKGGGLIGVLLVVGGALLLAGCQSCTAHGRAGRRGTKHP